MSNSRNRLTPRTQSAIKSARCAASSANSATSSFGVISSVRSRRSRAVSAMTYESRASVLASPAKVSLIRLTTVPGTYTTRWPAAISSASSRAAPAEVRSTAHRTVVAVAAALAISCSTAAWSLRTCRDHTMVPSASTSVAWCDTLPASIPTHATSTISPIPAHLSSIDPAPVDNSADTPLNSDHSQHVSIKWPKRPERRGDHPSAASE